MNLIKRCRWFCCASVGNSEDDKRAVAGWYHIIVSTLTNWLCVPILHKRVLSSVRDIFLTECTMYVM